MRMEEVDPGAFTELPAVRSAFPVPKRTADTWPAVHRHSQPGHPPQAWLGPWPYTLVMAALIVAIALIAHLASRGFGPALALSLQASRVPRYLYQVASIAMLLGTVTAGIAQRGSFFRSMLLHRRAAWWREAMRGMTVCFAMLLLFGALVTATTAVLASRHARQQAHTTTGRDAAPIVQENPKQIAQEARRTLRLDNRRVEATAPHNGSEMLAWVLVSVAAGVCEELIFRGYFLGQALAWMQRTRMNRTLQVCVAVLLVNVLFGSAHLYEGAGGATFIACLGVAYSVMRLRFGNLRSAIAAHTLQDLLAGWMLYAAHLHAH